MKAPESPATPSARPGPPERNRLGTILGHEDFVRGARVSPSSTVDANCRIGIFPPSEFDRHRCLLQGLAEILPVQLGRCEEHGWDSWDGLIFIGASRATVEQAAQTGQRCYWVPEIPNAMSSRQDRLVEFSRDTALDPVLQGQSLWERDGAICVDSPEFRAGDSILASVQGAPVWGRRQVGTGVIDIVAAPMVEIGELGYLCDAFNGRTFFGVLSLWQFLRGISGDRFWDAESLGACFVFDDPSLRSRTYGCLDFAKLAAHAREHQYHVAVATIPLDSLWVSERTARVFAENSQHLSLIIHGNNHTNQELTRVDSPADRLAMLAQALSRTERLQQTKGIVLERVMEAPHGVASWDMLEALDALNYEALLLTPDQFLRSNCERSWPASHGLGAWGSFGGGLCVIPRIKFDSDWRTKVVLAAFQRQPIVVVGHHQDALHGLDFLEEMTRFVRSLPRTRSCSLGEIARRAWLGRQDGDTLTVRVGSRCVSPLQIPAGCAHCVVERPWLSASQTAPLQVRTNDGRTLWEGTAGFRSLPVSLEGAAALQLRSPRVDVVDFHYVSQPRTGLWPILRKVCTEARDRLYPYAPPLWRLHPPAFEAPATLPARFKS